MKTKLIIKRSFPLFLAAVFILLLCTGCKGKTESSDTNEAEAYVFLCEDASGSEISGVRIKLCSDTDCMMEESDSEGRAVFSVKEGRYEAEVLSVPDGYEIPEESITTEEQYGRYIFEIKQK